MIEKYTILGERCSGTNLLESEMNKNFKLKLIWRYGWKHFFGFCNYKKSNNTLFIGIIRNPHTWMNSLYNKKFHLKYFTNIDEFLNNEFYSYNDPYTNGRQLKKNVKFITKKRDSEIMEDRNIYTKERYKNIFECRETKIKFLINDMPNKVKHFILITYEDLCNNYVDVMNKIKNDFNLETKRDIIKRDYIKLSIKDEYLISKDCIYNHSNFNKELESKFGYI